MNPLYCEFCLLNPFDAPAWCEQCSAIQQLIERFEPNDQPCFQHPASDDEIVYDTDSDILDLMYPYFVDVDGSDLSRTWTFEELTDEHVINNTISGCLLEELDDICICDIKIEDRPNGLLGHAGVHCMRLAELAFATAWNSAKLVAQGAPPTPLTHYLAAHQHLAKNSVKTLEYQFECSLLQLRAKVRFIRTISSDYRPTFDMSEQQQVTHVYELTPYIISTIDCHTQPRIINDPLAFGMRDWCMNASAVQRIFSLPVDFRPMHVCSTLLTELVNRRTILAGRDNPAAAFSRMTDIIERSPSFQEDHRARLLNWTSSYHDTRSVAMAMVTGRPWLTSQDF